MRIKNSSSWHSTTLSKDRFGEGLNHLKARCKIPSSMVSHADVPVSPSSEAGLRCCQERERHEAKTASRWETDASVSYKAIKLLNYALQSICPLIARSNMPGHDVLHTTFAVVKYSPISGLCLFLWEDARVHKV